jgi:hypothetical protein
MEFTVKINVDNAAYEDQDIQYQLIENLKDIIDRLEHSCDWGTVKDVNGNTVGRWSLDFVEEINHEMECGK